MTKETQKDRYHKDKTFIFPLRLVRHTEADIIQQLESVPNKSGYIKRLIREDIAKTKEDHHRAEI